MTLFVVTHSWINAAALAIKLNDQLSATRAALAEAEGAVKILVWYSLAMTSLVFYLWGRYMAAKEPKTVNISVGRYMPGAVSLRPFEVEFQEALARGVSAGEAMPASSWCGACGANPAVPK